MSTGPRVIAARCAYLFEFADLEDFGAAVGADALDRGATVFHRHLLGVFDLDLLALFDAVTLGHWGSPFAAVGMTRVYARDGLRRM